MVCDPDTVAGKAEVSSVPWNGYMDQTATIRKCTVLNLPIQANL